MRLKRKHIYLASTCFFSLLKCRSTLKHQEMHRQESQMQGQVMQREWMQRQEKQRNQGEMMMMLKENDSKMEHLNVLNMGLG